jgi:ABC-2 type transport system ATP-binding protein
MAGSERPMIEMEKLTRRFGGLTAVEDLTLRIHEGEVVGLLGPNGAGKTTTVRMLTGLIGTTSGTARVAGHRVGDPDQAQAIRRLVGLLPEEAGLYADLTPPQLLDFFARLYQVPKPARAERIEMLLVRLSLWDRRNDRVNTFSKGMRQRLAIARALVHDPPVLFLDEPTANLDPEGAKAVREFLVQLRQDRRTIVLNTHHLEEAERVCDRVAILDTRLIAVGTPAELRRSPGQPTTTVQLEAVTDAVLAAVRATGLGPPTVAGTSVTVAVADPARDNPDLVAAIVGAGGRVQFVSQNVPTLEDAYLSLVEGAS